MLEYLCPNCGAGHTPQAWRASNVLPLSDHQCPTCGLFIAGSLFTLPTRRNASQAIAHDVDCATAYLVACVERDAQRATDEYRAWATERTQQLMERWARQDAQRTGGQVWLNYLYGVAGNAMRKQLLDEWVVGGAV